uniref:RNase H type-1 domain-containing protein n=1 Tax=Nicotiana tabacum TaxID=4097 RepID=A0A1S4C2A9_TOBAC|nr:PREDICTED: uncharacterized protein LOC107814390 [Nicotiana tabacum]
MKHNPKKCAFGVSSGKFLGFLVSQRGIKINPDKIKAIEDTTDQLSVKEVQRLTWRLAALNRFIFRSSKKCHHFFSLLKKKNNYEWTLKYQQALKDLKRYLSSPPLLSKPEEGEADLLSDLGGSGVWTLFTDGASNVKGSGLGIVLISPSGETLRQAIRTVPPTNNEVEYEALIAGLELAWGLDSKDIKIKCESQLVVNQVYGIFETKEERMQQYVVKVQAMLAQFREW